MRDVFKNYIDFYEKKYMHINYIYSNLYEFQHLSYNNVAIHYI